MPTPGERRALLFLASVAALGVAVRGWRAFHPSAPAPDALGADRASLARQIEVVDSAVAAGGAARKARAAGPAAPRAPSSRTTAAPRAQPATRTGAVPRQPATPHASTSRARQPAPIDTQPRDPRQSYWERSLYFDSVRQALVQRDQRAAIRLPPSRPSSAIRHLPSEAAQPPVDLDLASVDEAAAIPLVGPALARRIVVDRIENGPFGSIAGLEQVPGITAAFARRLAPFVTFSGPPRLGSAGETRPRSKSVRGPGGASRP